MKIDGKKIESRVKTKRIQIRLTEQEHALIDLVLGKENISQMVREYLKTTALERAKNNEELENKVKEILYSDFFNSK